MAGGGIKDEHDHVAHEQVAIRRHPCGQSCCLSGAWCIWGGAKVTRQVFSEDVEDGNPELAGRFHADLLAVVLVKPVGQLSKPLKRPRSEPERSECGNLHQ